MQEIDAQRTIRAAEELNLLLPTKQQTLPPIHFSPMLSLKLKNNRTANEAKCLDLLSFNLTIMEN